MVDHHWRVLLKASSVENPARAAKYIGLAQRDINELGSFFVFIIISVLQIGVYALYHIVIYRG